MILATGRTVSDARELPQAAGRPGARVRFISEHFTWWLDAVGFATDASSAFDSLRGARRRSLRKPGAEQSGRHLLARRDRHCQRLDLQLHG